MNSPQLVHAARGAVPRDKFIRIKDVENITGLRKSTLYALQAKGEFPRSLLITPRCVAWVESQVLQWVQDRISKANPGQAETQGNEGVKP